MADQVIGINEAYSLFERAAFTIKPGDTVTVTAPKYGDAIEFKYGSHRMNGQSWRTTQNADDWAHEFREDMRDKASLTRLLTVLVLVSASFGFVAGCLSSHWIG